MLLAACLHACVQARDAGDAEQLAMALSNLGSSLTSAGQHEEGLKCLQVCGGGECMEGVYGAVKCLRHGSCGPPGSIVSLHSAQAGKVLMHLPMRHHGRSTRGRAKRQTAAHACMHSAAPAPPLLPPCVHPCTRAHNHNPICASMCVRARMCAYVHTCMWVHAYVAGRAGEREPAAGPGGGGVRGRRPRRAGGGHHGARHRAHQPRERAHGAAQDGAGQGRVPAGARRV